MNPADQTNELRPILDASDQRIEHALDTLGQAERDAAPASLEARAYGASIEALQAAAVAGPVTAESTPHAIRHPAGRTPAIAGRITPSAGGTGAGQSRRRIAIAAGLGALACVTALWLALRDGSASSNGSGPARRLADSTPAAPTELIPASDPDAELEAMFLASSLVSTGIDDEIESISASAASLGLSLTDPIGGEWSDPLWTGDSL